MNRIYCVILLIAAGSHLTARAEDLTLHFDQVARVALTNNPSLHAATRTIAEAKARLLDAGRFTNPQLESSFAPHVGGRERSFTIGFNQPFPLTPRLAAEKRLSRIQVALAEAEVAEYQRTLALEARSVAIQLWALVAQRQLNEGQLENSRSLQAFAREAAATGEGSAIAANQIELESIPLTARRAGLERDHAQTAAELKLLLGLKPSVAVTIIPPPTPLPALQPDRAFPTNRADYRAAVARATAARESISLARSAQWEDITLGLFTELDRNEDLPAGLETDHIVGLRIALPLPLWNRRKGRLTEAQTASQRADLEVAALRARIESEIALSQNQLNINTLLLETITRDLLPKARQFEEQLLHLHREGQTPFADLARAREQRLHLEASELDAQRDVHLSRARYLAAAGRDE